MTAHERTAGIQTSVDVARRIDSLCDEFEEALIAGDGPQVEEYLSRVDATDRSALLRELLPLELDARAQQGEQLTRDDCVRRFPEDAATINDTFLEREPPLSLDEFVHSVTASGLIDTDDLQNRATERGGNPYQLSRQLIEQGLLTDFQTRVLMQPGSHPLVLGDYDILDQLGQGGMGQVYKARHRRMERIVALKTLPVADATDEQWRARFHREVKAAARLSHPHIVTAFDAGEDNGVDYLVMEFVDGDDLGKVVRAHGPLPVETALDCVLQAARGLEYAHKQGVTHRDIKPSNLLLDATGTLKVLDMGLARLEQSDSANSQSATDLTGTGTVMGTIDYMSPEQAQNTKQADHRSDIYSLGITLHYLLTGKPAYPGSTVMERLIAHREQPIPSLHDSTKQLLRTTDDDPTLTAQDWQTIEAVFSRMIAKQPADRYQNMTDLIRDLEPLVQHLRQPASGSGQSTTSPTITLGAASRQRAPSFGSDTHPDRSAGLLTADQPTRLLTGESAVIGEGSTDRVPPQEIRIDTSAPLAPPPAKQGPPRWLVGTILGTLAAGLLLAGIVIMIDTPAGTVVINIADENAIGAEVQVDEQHLITIKQVGNLPITITPHAEQQTLKVSKPGFEVFTREFTLTDDNGDQVITVKLQPMAQSRPSQIATTDPAVAKPNAAPLTGAVDLERQAAEWVIQRGGHVKIRYPLTEYAFVEADTLDDLPADRFAVKDINLNVVDDLKDEELSHLAGLQQVNSVDLRYTPVSDDGLRHLARLTSMSYLYLAGCPNFDGSGLRHLTDYEELIWLDLLGTPILDENLEVLSQFPRLSYLYLGPTTTGVGLRHLATCRQIHSLRIEETQVKAADLSVLRELPQLENVTIGGQQVTSQFIKQIEAFPHLERLMVVRSDSKPDLSLLQPLQNLKTLDVSHLTDTLMANVPPLPHLKKLTSTYGTLSDTSILHLAAFLTLRELDVRHNKFTREGIEQLRRELPGCRIVSDHGTFESADRDREAALWVLAQGGRVQVKQPSGHVTVVYASKDLPQQSFQLEAVYLGGIKSIDDEALAHLEGLNSLSSLELEGTQLSNAGMQQIGRYAALTNLQVSGTLVTGAGLSHISHLKGLNGLSLAGLPISDADLEQLHEMQQLTGINLSGTQVTDAGVKTLQKFPRLEGLIISYTEITDVGLQQLTTLSKLRQLTLKKTQVTQVGVKRLVEELPDCHIISDFGTFGQRARELQVAEWVLSVGGRLTVSVHPKGLRMVRNTDDLPEKPFAVQEVFLEGITEVKDSHIRWRLNGLEQLHILSLEGTSVTDTGLGEVGRWTTLEHLKLMDTQVTDAGLVHLSKLKRLGFLNLIRLPITDDGLRSILGLKNLVALDLQSTKITNDGLRLLLELPKLTALSLKFTAVTDEGLARLAELTGLKSLGLEGTKITDSGLAHLQSLNKLTSLDVRRTQVTEQGIATLRQALPQCSIESAFGKFGPDEEETVDE